MIEIKILNILIFTFTSFVLTYYFFVLRKRENIEETRDSLFRLREEFFEKAIETELNFNSPSYRLIEDQINRRIRFVHQARFISIALSVMRFGKELDNVREYKEAELAESISKLSYEQKKLCKRTINKLHVITGIHIVCESIFAKSTMYLAVIFLFLRASGKVSFKKQKKKVAKSRIFEPITTQSETLAYCY